MLPPISQDQFNIVSGQDGRFQDSHQWIHSGRRRYCSSRRSYGIPIQSCILGGGLCSVSGILPDLDSDSGVPYRESVAFISAFVPMLLISRFQSMGWPRETIVLACALLYIGIRFGVAKVFRKLHGASRDVAQHTGRGFRRTDGVPDH